MEKENKFIKPEADIIVFTDEVILTSGGIDVEDIENPGAIPFF